MASSLLDGLFRHRGVTAGAPTAPLCVAFGLLRGLLYVQAWEVGDVAAGNAHVEVVRQNRARRAGVRQ